MLGHPGNKWKVVLAVSLTAGVLPCAAKAGPWELGAGGGWSSAYQPYPQPFGSRGPYESTWLLSVSLARTLTPSLQIRSQISGFAHEAERAAYYGVYGTGRAQDIASAYGTEQSRVGILPIAIGLRVHGSFGRSGISPYLELLPTLFLVRWEESASGTIYLSPDSTSSFSTHRELHRPVPGATLGMGFNLRGGDSWNLDYGIQYRLSSQIAAESSATPELSRGPLQPIATLALAMSITWSPQ